MVTNLKAKYLKLAADHTRKNVMTREDAISYVSFCVDDALSERDIQDMPANARLVGWLCGFEPMFVAVWSYLDGKLTDDEAADCAGHRPA